MRKFVIMVVGATIVVIAGATLDGRHASRLIHNSTFQSPPANPTSNHQLAELDQFTKSDTLAFMPAERARLDSIEFALRCVAQKSPTARKLLAFYERHACRARYLSNELYMVVEAPRSDTSFFVVANPNDLSPAPGRSVVIAGYHGESQHLHVTATPLTTFVRGLYVAHEVQHAYDHLVRGEPPALPLSPDWISGELRASQLVNQMLNEYTRNRWQRMVEASADSREDLKRQRGISPQAFTFGTDSVDVAAIIAVFGDLPFNDISALTTQLTVDLNLESIRRFAGDDVELVAAGQYTFMQSFFQRANPVGLILPR